MVAADVQRLEALWANPSLVAASDMSWLSGLVEANPAALPLWWLYLRAVQKAESSQFTQVLHRCAALSPNRAALMAWVEEPLQPVASSEAVPSELASGDSLLVPPVSGEMVSGDSLLVPPVSGDSSIELNQEQQETSNEKLQETSNEKLQEARNEKPIPALAENQSPARPEPKATNAAALNLDALPERVREQILRARAARAQLAEVGFGSAPSVPKVEPAAEVSTKVEPAAEAAPRVAPAVAVKPTPEVPQEVPHAEEPASAPVERVAKQPKSAKIKKHDEGQLVSEPASPASPASPALPTDLSPFAQFVANLERAKSTTKGTELIDQFLSVNPKISPLAKDAPAPEVRTEPDANVTGLVTETLARMYAEQGHIAKAIQAYEILKLRVPEKSSIFAARIEALKTK